MGDKFWPCQAERWWTRLDSFELLIQNGSKIYYPIVEDKVKLTWERKGTPGKLEFTVVKDGIINFQEGKVEVPK